MDRSEIPYVTPDEEGQAALKTIMRVTGWDAATCLSKVLTKYARALVQGVAIYNTYKRKLTPDEIENLVAKLMISDLSGKIEVGKAKKKGRRH